MTTRDPFPMEKFDNDDKFGNKTTNQGFQVKQLFRRAENSLFVWSENSTSVQTKKFGSVNYPLSRQSRDIPL